MSKRPLSGGKLPKKARKLTPAESLKVQLEEARKDAANLKKAIGELAVMALTELAEVEQVVEDNLDSGAIQPDFDHLKQLLEGFKKVSEVTIA